MASLADLANSIGEAASTVAHADLTPVAVTAAPIIGNSLAALAVLAIPFLVLQVIFANLEYYVFAPRRRRAKEAKREAYGKEQREQAARRAAELRQRWEQQRKGLY